MYKQMFTLANGMTLINLLCGAVSIQLIFSGQFELAYLLFGLGLLMDFGDGFVARAMNTSSDFGKQLDSLADLISFGLLPGVFMFDLIERLCGAGNLWPYFGFIFTIFAGLRLAKFNVDTRQTVDFLGLNTPSASIFVIGTHFALFSKYGANGQALIWEQPILLLAILIVIGLLMISDIPMISLKVTKDDPFRRNLQYLLVGISLISIILFRSCAIPFIILVYIVLSLLLWFKNKKDL